MYNSFFFKNHNDTKSKCYLFLKLLTASGVFLLTLMSVNSNLDASINENNNYTFLVVYPGNQNIGKIHYVSDVINYNGGEDCFNSYKTSGSFYSAAKDKFLNYLQYNYGLKKSEWKIQFNGSYSNVDFPSAYWTGYSSQAAVVKAINSYSSENNKKVTTGFKFQCSAGTAKQGNTTTQSKDGKAWWYTYYLDEINKKLYISYVYNNSCNHCSNEIRSDFRKWLILNDYVSSPSTVHITSLHDISEKSLEERRTNTLLKYKERKFTVFNLSYKYNH